MRRRAFVIALAAGCVGNAVAQRPAQSARSGETAADAGDAAGGRNDPGLLRLEAALGKQLAAGNTALPWSETILAPDKSRLVWRPHSLRAPKGRERFRVAIDPPTRWYYVGRVGRDGSLTLYGPIDERAKGRFVDALGPAADPAPDAPEADRDGRPGAKTSR